MRCPHCKNRVLQKSGEETRLRIRGALKFDEDGNAHAQCHWCKSDIVVPVQLDYPEDDVQRERFTVRLTQSGRPDTP